MPTNLDRLHQNFQRLVSGRQTGKTHMSCHLVAGAVETGNKTVFIILPNMQWRRHVSHMLESVFQEHDLHFSRETINRWRVGASRVLIVSAEFAERDMLGYDRNRAAIVDFTWEELDAFFYSGEKIE